MTRDIIIRTYHKDAEWLKYCLATLIPRMVGFRQIVVLCPADSREAILPVARTHGCNFYECDELNVDGYVGQMATKMCYDQFTDADIITHVDSDMIFFSEFNPSMVHNSDGQVIICKQEYKQLNIHWKPVVEKLVGFEHDWEYNRMFPISYPRWLYKHGREHLEAISGKPFKELMASIENREFSECNVLGAIGEKYHAHEIDFRDVTRDPIPGRPCACYWSYAGITPDIQAKIDRLLK